MMTVTILYFAWIREKIGREREQITLPEGVCSAADLIQHLAAQGPGYADAFADSNAIRVAVNREIGSGETKLKDGGEIAFFPPVTGG